MESQLIDRSKPVPLYHQVKDSLRERIDAHEWEPGMKIPTEKELAEEYGVSQITVKQALSRLSMEGLVERYQGRGTFVCQSPLVQDILTLAGFSASFAQAGIEIESRLIGTAVIPASEGISRRLSIDPGESVIEVRRVRLTKNVPVCLQTSYLPYTLCHSILDRNLAKESLFELLRETCDLDPARAEEALNAVSVDDYEARILMVNTGSPAFLIRRTTFDQSGVPIEFAKSVLRGDRCKFTVSLNADATVNGREVKEGLIGIKTQVS
ncbi:MAG: GntR family transcriptional regulator [Firmicutes bacterium]|nr:GntR family transcriptional regulator [Bacillota bacterium]HXL04965.1 GntR family transcriptional regulator [Bacillota bacterium]